jgi:hypothetical protein
MAVLTGVAIVASQSHVHGYIDPGSTSMLLQGIIGGVAAVLVITRSYWSRAVGRVQRALAGSSENPAPAGKDGDIPTPRPGA